VLLVSAEYEDKINSPTRRCLAKVKIYFDGPLSTPVIFDNDTIVRFVLLEEARTESSSPIGRVSSNEFTLDLDNSDRKFTLSDEDGPYFGKLIPNVKVEPFIGLEIDYPSEGNVEWIPLGVFWTGDWDAPSAGVEASVVCYDRLYQLGERDLPPFLAMKNTTIFEMATKLFLVLGLSATDFEVDPSLTQRVRIGWFPKGKVWGALQALAVAGSCTITVNRFGKIVVINNFRLTESVAIFDDDSQIFDMNIPQEYANIFTSTLVRCTLPVLSSGEQILDLDELIVPAGSTTFRGLGFNRGPVAALSQLSLRGAKTSSIKKLRYGAWSMDLTIVNSGASETVSLYATGFLITSNESTVSRTEVPLAALYGFREQTIEGDLIQDISAAREYAALAGYIGKDPKAYFTANVRGNPAVELLDTVTIRDPSDKFKEEEVVVLRSVLEYDGGLSGTLEGIRKEALIVKDWVFMCPGMYALQPRHFELR
jgi:hypothetical protein